MCRVNNTVVCLNEFPDMVYGYGSFTRTVCENMGGQYLLPNSLCPSYVAGPPARPPPAPQPQPAPVPPPGPPTDAGDNSAVAATALLALSLL